MRVAPEDGELISAALEGQLTLLAALTGATAVSVWAGRDQAVPRHVAHTGELDVGAPQTLAAVQAVLDSEGSGPVPGDATLGVRLGAVGRPAGRWWPTAPPARPQSSARCWPRRRRQWRDWSSARPEGTPAHWRESVTGAVERRLARLRFDLHDGPQQDVILLAQDVRLFREQLRPLLDGNPDQARALGRLDDLEAQLLALDGDLRRLSTSVQSPFLAPDSLLESLQRVTEAFAERSGILPETEFVADLTQLSDSQQIALLALVREALSNVRKHGDATTVRVSITADADGITVRGLRRRVRLRS